MNAEDNDRRIREVVMDWLENSDDKVSGPMRHYALQYIKDAKLQNERLQMEFDKIASAAVMRENKLIESNRLNDSLKKALLSVRDQLSLMMTPGVAIAKVTVSGCIDDLDAVLTPEVKRKESP